MSVLEWWLDDGRLAFESIDVVAFGVGSYQALDAIKSAFVIEGVAAAIHLRRAAVAVFAHERRVRAG